eukprot:TRINITY_DN10264_c0_g1_i1.p2 TRINITY_DN10264_c0_g1~~TRINITY_DN10264_c0_g1_i1.p2  ORF type:complete len:209 (-),score=84.27 TRINITY_DN10264_c0_g1_i1:277-903(-)
MTENVFLFVPNLIGYVRAILALVGFAVGFDRPWLFFVTYTISFMLDAADGYFARLLNQCTSLGAVLDMVVDRCGTAGLCVILSHLYPSWRFSFIALICLDFVSHWYKMYSALKDGKGHKTVSRERSHPLLYLYYTSRPVLGCVCAGNEFFYLGLYAYHWSPTILILAVILVCAPVWLFKQLTNGLQLVDSAREVAEMDRKERAAAGHK